MKLEKSRIWKAACCKKSRTLYRNSFHKCSLYSAQNLSLNIFGDSHWWTSLLTRLYDFHCQINVPKRTWESLIGLSWWYGFHTAVHRDAVSVMKQLFIKLIWFWNHRISDLIKSFNTQVPKFNCELYWQQFAGV